LALILIPDFFIGRLMPNSILLLLSLLLLIACRKTEIKEVPVEKEFSWKEIKRFKGTERIFLSSGASADALYFQQPFFFTEIKNQSEANGITVYGAFLPSDIYLRTAISSEFFAMPFSDTVLRILNNKRPVAVPSGGYFNLKQIDPSLTSIQKNYLTLFKLTSITKNGALLFAYHNNRIAQPLTFMIFKIKTYPTYPYIDTLYTKQVTIPKIGAGYVRHITAINDFFLADLSDNGIYKIREDGTFNKVSSPAVVDAFYEWQGKIYAHAEWNRLLISSNNGDNWQEYTGTSTAMTLSNYYVIKDSLVGVYNDNIFTLKWVGNDYALRILKNDGVEGSAINGIEILKDTVYLATTAGLYVKPATEFFESK
jgi:hypothetical protein